MKFKTVVVIILSILIVATSAFLACDTLGFVPGNGKDLVISFWGDSIAEGVLGPSPLAERDYYAYGHIVGERNEYEFHNRSVSGHTTQQFYDYITRTGVYEDGSTGIDNGPMMTGTLLRTSDIIGISMLGNDLLNKDLGDWLELAVVGDYEALEETVSKTKEVFYQAIDYIRECNPNALILVQTVYNPIYVGSPISQNGELVLSEERLERLAAKGVNAAAIRMFGGKMVEKLNSIIYDYRNENEGAIEIVDVYSEFDRIYNTNRERGKALFFTDGIHPSNEGHAVIADLYQKILDAHHLTKEPRVLRLYKKLRINQLERLFSKSGMDIKAAKKAINKSETCKDITNAYFRAIDGYTPVVTELPDHKISNDEYYTSRDETYYITNNSTVNPGMEINGRLLYNSYIELSSDGTIEIVLKSKWVNFLLNAALSGATSETDLSVFNLRELEEQYLKELFPGFTFDDLEGSLGLIKDNLGIEVSGINFEDKGIQEICKSLKDNRTLPSNPKIEKGIDLTITYTGTYTLQKVRSEVTGIEYEQISIDKHPNGGDSYIIGCRDTDPETGKRRVYFRIEFLKMYVEAIRK